MWFDNTGPDTVITGLTLALGDTGILVEDSSPLILGNRIENNITTDMTRGGGITVRIVDVDGEADPIIQSNTIVFNRGFNGAGVAVFEGASATLYDNRIVSNQTLLLNVPMQPVMPGEGCTSSRPRP